MNACKPGTYILLGAGSFSFTTTFTLVNGVTLRGSGGTATTINVSGTTFIDLGVSADVTTEPLTGASSNYTVGTKSFVITTSTAPSVGQIVYLTQCNAGLSGNPCTGAQADNSGIWVCSYVNTCNQSGGTPNSISNASQSQTFLVTSVTNNGSGTYTIGTNSGLYAPNWAFARTPYMSWQSGIQEGMGLEDLTLDFTFNTSEQIQVAACYGCWVKGLRVIGSPTNQQVSVGLWSLNDLLMNNDYENFDPSPSNYFSSGSSLCVIAGEESNLLELNEIHHGCIREGGGIQVGDVFAYNYFRDSQTSYYQNSEFNHEGFGAGSMYMLREGNEIGVTYDDNTWGTKDLNTWFRNYVSGWDPPYVIGGSGNGNARGILINAYNRLENAIGNVTGGTYLNTYQVTNGGTTYGYCWAFNGSDAYNQSTALRWGNVCSATQSTDTPANSGVRFVPDEVPNLLNTSLSIFSNTAPSSDSLPCSFFLPGYTSTSCTPHRNGQTGLPFWKVCTKWTTFPTSCSSSQTQPFPAIGPDVSDGPYVHGYAYDIPTMIAWQNLPIDPTYQHSYTVTASSWSSGTETLAVSGLPSSNLHVMGGFQLSGAASACNPSGGELLMTSSSTGTISYALPTNPGPAICTGNMLFPDVRQFDERVYQADSGVLPGPPTSVTGAVAPKE